MKKKFYLWLVAALFMGFPLFANVVTIKGYVKLSNGSPAINTEVKIAVYLASSTTSCSEQSVVTNSNGYYTKDLTCNGDIRRTRIALKNCDGTTLVQEKEVPSTKVVEANFSICLPRPQACVARFTSEPVATALNSHPFTVRFNSNSSEVGSADKIIHTTWDFHDGTALVKDRMDPLHTFPHAGVYEVCLTIKTALGCESKICKQITVATVATVTCAAKFTFEKLVPKKFRFNSTLSSVSSNDNIVARKWDFRDGVTSNDESPVHEFDKPGTYEVCLYIKTAKGCESKTCSVVKVEEVPNSSIAPIQIVSLYPTPVHENLKVGVLSTHTNILATISIVNAHGIVLYTLKITLNQGNNAFSFPVKNLTPGSYFIKIMTQYGIVSKSFYKV